MIIHVYAICWNEEKMLPYFFKHYDNIADKYFIYDNGSTDNSLSILRSHPKVSIDQFEVKGGSLILSAVELFNQIWKKSIGKADWVIVCDVDEHLYHPNLKTYLQENISKGITLDVTTGFEMVSDYFPNTDQPLNETIRHGVRSSSYDKPLIFNPNAIQEINFTPGRHNANPIGNVIKPPKNELLLLHYKYIGFDYLNSRHNELKQGLRQDDLRNSWGYQYLWNEQQRLEIFKSLKNQSIQVL